MSAQVGICVRNPADPNRISYHANGGSVELTLVDEYSAEIDMGTGFDHFGSEAAALHFEKDGANQKTRDNHRILPKALLRLNFDTTRTNAGTWTSVTKMGPKDANSSH